MNCSIFRRTAVRRRNFFLPKFLSLPGALLVIFFSAPGWAQMAALPSSAELKKLSVEDLMDIEVTSVSKRPEKLKDVSSAIQVITREDIRQSGATSVPEALRLAPNLQVAQVNASQWAISARGFNNVLSNKLLVLIDGRVVYTPLYAGVFWDAQNLLLEDIERIEVISGPGGTLWGANAVNGVINITTRSSAQTKGLFAEGGAGTLLRSYGGLRYGGNVGEHLTYRVYGTAFKKGSLEGTDGSNPHDDWTMFQGGFRLDWDAGEKDVLTLQSNYYDNRPDPDGKAPVIASGKNATARWSHTVSTGERYQLQAYYDETWRNFGNGFAENLRTYDVDWHIDHHVGQRQTISWGAELRLMDDHVSNLSSFTFEPGNKLLHFYSVFVQDEIAIIQDRLRLTVGSKVEHNNYTGIQYSPNIRLALTPSSSQMFWAAVSRALRNPSRIDRDFSLYAAPGVPVIAASGDRFQSESLLAYELGWRYNATEKFNMSVATFYNVYDNIRSAEPGPAPAGIPITFANGVKGNTYGAEVSSAYNVSGWWRLRGGYTFLKKELAIKPTSADLNGGTAESDDPEQQFLIQSMMSLPGRIELGAVLRYVDKLSKPVVPNYTELDLRAGWKLNKYIELNIVGQNLIGETHAEFIPSSPAPRRIQRSVYGKIICRF